MFTCGLLRSNFSLLIGVFYSSHERRATPPYNKFCLEPAMRFELMTSSLPRRRSTPELRGRESNINRGRWSGRRDSNSRPSAWKADALPTELHPPNLEISNLRSEISMVQGVGFEPT